ncbi:MAG: hydrogen gas-evolving membrane-bound hydrogenase subunit E [Candidatus Omnitrophota bacterium]
MIELHLILIFMIIGALVAMEAKDLLSSVIALGAVGMGLTLEFLLLRAPDLAITQLVVEILSLVILIQATVGVTIPPEKIKVRLGYFAFAIIFCAIFLWFGHKALAELPAFGNSIMKMGSQYLAEGLSKTGAANMVAAIILDFRGYDTLGEATILFASVIGVLAVLRNKDKKK